MIMLIRTTNTNNIKTNYLCFTFC